MVDRLKGMKNIIKDKLVLKASNDVFISTIIIILLCLPFVLLGGSTQSLVHIGILIIVILALVVVLVICVLGIIGNRHGLVLTPEGISYGTIEGKRQFKWSEIRAVGELKFHGKIQVYLEVETYVAAGKANKVRITRLPETYGMEASELSKTILRFKGECEF